MFDGTIAPIDGIAAVDSSSGDVVTSDVFVRNGSTTVDVAVGVLSCTSGDSTLVKVNATDSDPGSITCTVTFNVDDFTIGSTAETIDLASDRKLQMGDVDTSGSGSVTAAYFEIDSDDFPNISVSNVTVTEIQVSWQVSIPFPPST